MSRHVWMTIGAAIALGFLLTPTGAAAASGPTPARWSWPVSPPSAVVRGFEAPPGPYAAGHRGIDVAASAGRSVIAPSSGTVTFAGVVVDRPVMTIRAANGALVSLEPVTASAPVGASVAQGAAIGTVGHGGHCSARCLHLGVRVDGSYVSPLLFLGSVPAAVLLPLD